MLGISLDPVDGVFQPSPDEPEGVYAIVTRSSAWIHFQIRRGATITQRPQMAPYGIRELVVEDLNGFRLVFGELSE